MARSAPLPALSATRTRLAIRMSGSGLVERVARAAATWEALGIAAVLLLSAALEIVGLQREAYGNTYYAAAVKSMLTSWHNFFFASFDSGGFVTVDKPPLGLWVQATSAWMFGFSGLSLLLPQAVAGVLTVALLYWLVRRSHGPLAGILAALALAVAPISVVTSRNNTMDAQLVLLLVLAAWAASRATETGRLRPLLVCAALAGLAYNVKMLQAFMVVPAFWAAYLLLAPTSLRQRAWHLTAATALLLAVSLSWSIVVDLTPADSRPFVGSSGSNSAISLALGYNGLGRVTEAITSRIPVSWLGDVTVDLSSAPGFAPGIGSPSLLRLFSAGLADEASWPLPLALLGLGVAAYATWRDRGLPSNQQPEMRRQRVAVAIWGGWLLLCGGYFSFARFYHVYYLIMLGPAVAALAGIGVAEGWRAYRRGGWARTLLPLMLLATALLQVWILLPYLAWALWLAPLVLVGTVIASLGLLVTRRAGRVAMAGAALGVLSLVLAPAAWSIVSVRDNNGAAWLPQSGPAGGFGGGRGFGGPQPGRSPGGPAFGNPQPGGGGASRAAQAPNPQQPNGRGAGPQPQAPGGPSGQNQLQLGGRGFGGPGGPGGPGGGPSALTFAGEQWNSLDQDLVRYLLANQGSARFLVATPASTYASLFMLATDQPAMALGGYQGWDRILTVKKLQELVSESMVRFFYLEGAGGGDPRGGPGGPGNADPAIQASRDGTSDLVAWVRATCEPVPPGAWDVGSGAAPPRGTGGSRGKPLYDCAPSAQATMP